MTDTNNNTMRERLGYDKPEDYLIVPKDKEMNGLPRLC